MVFQFSDRAEFEAPSESRVMRKWTTAFGYSQIGMSVGSGKVSRTLSLEVSMMTTDFAGQDLSCLTL